MGGVGPFIKGAASQTRFRGTPLGIKCVAGRRMLLQDAHDVECRCWQGEEDHHGPVGHVSMLPSQPMQGHGQKRESSHYETPGRKFERVTGGRRD